MHFPIDYIPMKVYWEFINSEAAEEKEEDLWVFIWRSGRIELLMNYSSEKEMWLFVVWSLMKNTNVSLGKKLIWYIV